MLSKSLRIPATPVPTARNTHLCMGIYLPDDVIAYGQLPIAVEPYLDNRIVMHHINVWPCTDVPSKLTLTLNQFLAQGVIYTSRAYATISVPVCLSVCLSVTEVHCAL